jgi:hypothetical protein
MQLPVASRQLSAARPLARGNQVLATEYRLLTTAFNDV